MKNYLLVNRALAAEKKINLIEMLQGCSKRNGTTFRQSNPDGQPTVNRQSRLMSYRGNLKNLAMIFAVLVLSMANIGMAWGADFTPAQIVASGGTTASNIKVSSSYTSVTTGKKLCSSQTKVDAVSISNNANADYNAAYVEIQATSGSISTLGLKIRGNTDGAGAIVLVFWSGDAQAAFTSYSNSYNYIARDGSDCDGLVNITVPSNTKTVRIYKSIRVKDGSISGASGYTTVAAGNTLNIFGISATASGGASKKIYLKNSMGWASAHVTLLGTSSYWDGTNGSGSYGKTTYTMSYDSGKKLFYVDVPSASNDTYLCFTKDKQENYGNFYNTEAVYVNGGYSFGKVVWVGTSTTFYKNGTKYYGNEDHTQVNKEDYSADVFLSGSYNSWAKNAAAKFTEGTPYTKTVSLTAGNVYTFKVVDNAWFGNPSWLTDDKGSMTFSQTDGDLTLLAGITGDYTFTYNRSTHVVAVDYPTIEHPSAGYIYLRKTWDHCHVHWWYNDGSDHALTTWGSDPEITTYTTICEQPYYYFPLLTTYNMLIGKDAAGDAGDGGNNKTGNMNSSSNGGKYIAYNSGWGWNNFATYTISYGANGGGSSMSSETGICPNGSRALTSNAFTPPSGCASFSHWTANVNVTANGTPVTAGNPIADGATLSNINSNIALTAVWKLSAPTITQTANYNNFTISGSIDGAFYKYSIDGTTPTNAYSSAVVFAADITAKAIATKSGYVDSEVASQACTYINCSITDCGNATLTYTISASTSSANTAANLVSATNASNTTALGVPAASSAVTLSTITFDGNNGKKVAKSNECYSSEDFVMSSKIGMYNGAAYSSTNYLQFAFTVKEGYTFTPCDIQFVVQPVEQATNFRWEVTDGTTTYGYGTASSVGHGSSAGATVLTGLTSTSTMAAGTYYIRLYPYVNAASKTFRIGGDVILKGTTAAAACTAPATVNVTATVNEVSGYWFYPGDDVVLTATPTGSPAGSPVTYQWKKNDSNVGTNSATLTINDAAASDAGKYTCTISYGACSTTSAEFSLKCMQFYLKNSGGGDISNHVLVKEDATHASLTLELTGGTTYKFRVTDGCNNWYGNTGTMTSSNCTNWTMNADADCSITTNSTTGEYTFNFDFTDGILGYQMKVSVIYPGGDQASGKIIYWDNSVLNWAAGKQWYRIGKKTNNTNTQMTLVPGTANLYKVTTAEYNGFQNWHIANNDGNGTGNIFWTKGDEEHAITHAMAFEGTAVSTAAITVTPSAVSPSQGTTSDNDNCYFYSYTKTNGMKTDRVTISDYSNGTITVNYVDTDEEAASFTSGNHDLAHTVIITPTATPATGYNLGSLTVNEVAHTSGNTYTVTANTTIAATFTAKTYNITLDRNGASSGSESVTMTYNSSSHTAITAPVKAGYTFDGWYDTETDNNGSGNLVMNASGVLQENVTGFTGAGGIWTKDATCTLYAKWTAAASLTAISADSLYQAASMANITFTGSDQNFTGLSTNNLFKVYGTDGNAAKGKNENHNVTDDISTKSFTSALYILSNSNTTSTDDPTQGAIEIITPSTAGLLYLYLDADNSSLTLKKQGTKTSTSLSGATYKAMEVDANTHYFINGSTSGKRGLYGIQYVSTYAVTITPTNVTKATGDETAIKGKAYTATFTANTGYTLPSDVTVTIGGASCTKGTEYTWSVSDGTGTLTVKAANVTGAIVVTISGVAPSGHTVTYNYNGATGGATPASATGASVTLPSPTRSGFELDGWYTTDGIRINAGGETYSPTADITLYARWQKACDAGAGSVATFNFNAGNSTGLTIETNGANATYSVVNSKTNNIPVLDSYFLASSFKNDASGIITITTDATYTDIDSIKLNSAATDNANPKIAIFTVSGETETKQQSAFVLSSGSVKTWRATPYKKDLSSSKPDGKVRFKLTTGGSGKHAGLDNIQIFYGGGSGTCRHIYYHGNGAESGFVSDTTSYADGAKATVLSYNDSRYPLAKEGYDFQGWATSAGGSVAYSAGQKIDITSADVDLYAVWAAESDALVTWTMGINTSTWSATATSTTDGTNISSIGTTRTNGSDGAREVATAKVTMATAEVSGTAAPSNSANFTFTIAGGKQVEINKFDCKVFNVASGNRTYKAQISDEAGNVYNSTNKVAVSAEATLTDASFVFGSGKILRGAVTIRIYAWGSGSEFRMGPDVKFYGTVENYECATPSAPTISGVSEYVPGQTITLTASHDGENYDNLTTYTWYKGDTWGGKSEVQAAATGESGYTLTIADCTTGDAGLYWCEAANGTCNAHNSEGYNIIVYPTYTITYNLNGGDWGEVEHKVSYTRFDEDYTLPTPTKTGYVFAGWYGASDFSGLPTVVLGAGSVGDKEYWAKWGATVTVSWTVTKVDDELYRGGGGYSVKAVINETNWSTGFMDELELTATEGVTLKNIEVSENDESKVQVTADFDITTDLAANATQITFTLSVPADGTYGPKVDEHEETLTSCGGGFDTDNSYVIGKSNSDATNISSSAAFRAYKTASDWYSKGNTTFTDKTSTDGFTISAAEKSYYWQNNGTFTESSSSNCRLRTIKLAKSNGVTIRWTNDELSFSKVRFIGRNTAADDPTTFTVSNGTTEKTFTFEAGNSEIQTKEVTMDFVSGNTKGIVISGGTKEINILIELIPTSVGGVTPTLTWDDGDADIANDGVSKSTSNDDFVYTASQDKNSLGAITYSSSDATVATVNSTTGQVHLVGAAGSATITATIAASGCFSSANVSYTITVTDDCDDEAGTIETEDLGCSGVKMTVTGHTAAAGVIYQWYKVGTPSDATVGTNQDNFTATEAGSYYVIVTNTGDRHCAKRSTNTITVEAQAAATVTKIVDSWYVKKDRRTPDVELVKTTGATGFTVKIGSTVIWNSDGSNTTGFAGCGFRMDENGIIYLNGTKDGSSGTSDNADAPAHGDETWTAGDVTLTITAIGCGSSASQTITIHKQAATNYKEIAFVADGGKGMKKDSITVGHGDGTELYEYLDSVGTAAGNRLFQLSERNIYWTTDEKAIREEYSQFDAILITDDPSTNTVVKKGDDYKTKGYVNAFGTMVDVRPIFTMEAYVSALKNWGSKGIAGNPQSPNPRQYEMRLECKDHEIYGSGLPEPSDGTNVWEEVIDGETFRHVIIVDSTKGVYNGVAYNVETAGDKKPALQGFTGEAAGSLLGLGRILEGTLQAAIERQEEPAARLLVMGINAKALQPTCALTNEGKAVIKNILVYLLKTNMEEVDDCSNYFTGKTNSLWNEPSNWSKRALPSSEAKVRILAPCVISGIQPHVLQVSIVNSGNSNIRYTATSNAVCNGTLTIEPDGALIADGKIRSAVAPHFAANDLMPTTPEMLTINTNGSGQAALIFDNEEAETQATVNLYSLGRVVSSTYQFQYMAVPMEVVPVNPSFANETHGGKMILTYVWNENGGWERRGYYEDLRAFECVGITTNSTSAMTYTMEGNLASTSQKEIALTNGSGAEYANNIIGNSWTAPIDIASLKEAIGDDSNVQKTIYIYVTGNDGDEASSGTSEDAGQWLAIPIEASSWSGWSGLKVIPAMQAFLIRVSAETSLELNYNDVVRKTATENLNEPLRAPRRAAADKDITMTTIHVADSKTYADLRLFEGKRFDEEFDNGWEAEYLPCDGRTATLYAETEAGQMAVAALPELEGTVLGFAPGKETVYTFTFLGGNGEYYLNDLKLKNSTLMSAENSYVFTYEEGDTNRFYISRTAINAPEVATGMEDLDAAAPKVQKIIYNDKLYIIRGGKVYSADGQVVK